MAKRLFALALSLLMLISVFAGCTPNPANPTDPTKKTDPQPTGNPGTTTVAPTTTVPEVEFKRDPIDITIVGGYCSSIEQNNFIVQKVKELFNINLEMKMIDLSDKTQVQMMLNSGEMPDCGWILGFEPSDMYYDEITRAIPDEMIRAYAPDYAARLDSEPVGWHYYKAPDVEDAHIGLPGYFPADGADVMLELQMIRLDWLENLGIEVPGELVKVNDNLYLTTTPYTQDQFTEILRRFTEDDPDGNGKDDTVAYAAQGEITTNYWFPFSSIFSVQQKIHSTMKDADGKAQYYYVTENYREMLKYAAEMYAKGYIEKEFPTLTSTQVLEQWANGKYGVTGYRLANVDGTSSVNPIVSTTAQNGKLLFMPTPVNNEGVGGTPNYSATNYYYKFVVNKDVDDEKLARILEMYNYFCHTEEGWILGAYGIEGEHFEYREYIDGVGYGFTLKEGVKFGEKTGLKVLNYYSVAVDPKRTFGPNRAFMNDYFREPCEEYILTTYRYDLAGETNLAELKATYDATIKTIVQEYWYNAITGSVDIDATWDDYVDSLYDAGYDKIQEELDKAPLMSDLVAG